MLRALGVTILVPIVALLSACGGAGGAAAGLVVTALTPSTVAVGGPAFTLSVAGTGFSAGAVITWNGQALATSVVSSTQVTAQVPASLIASTGTASIQVVNLPFSGAVPSNTLQLIIGQASAISISKTHSGNFVQGQNGVTYTIVVRNGPSGGATQGTISVTDHVPGGLSATALGGAGWSCDLASATCTRTDSLTPSSSFAPITLTVNVAGNAPTMVTNTATVSGGGSGQVSTSDVTTINPPASPTLTINKSHSGDFTQGQTGASYALTVHNGGTGATSGTVTVSDALPAGLTATGISGAGWICDPASLACTRTDALAPGGTYPAITLTVDVSATAPANVVNSASVSGGGSPSSSANDPTTINPPAPPPPVLAISKSHSGDLTIGQVGAVYTITVTNSGKGPTSGAVTVTDVLPAGLTATGLTGTGWTCDLTSLSCSRNDAPLSPGAMYPSISLTVNVTATAATTATNTATVSGGGSKSASTGDSTNIVP